jgi:hypothetical protein
MKTLWLLFAASVFVVGCGGARSPELYRDDTKKLLDGKSGDIKACYDGILQTDQKANGKVTVKFAFQEDTGQLIDAKIDPANTTAPNSLGQCVLSSLRGIVLTPGDKRRGEATWSWDFSAAQAQK